MAKVGRQDLKRPKGVSTLLLAAIITFVSGYWTGPAFAREGIDIDPIYCKGTWVSDGWGNDVCVSASSLGSFGGSASPIWRDIPSADGGGAQTDTTVAKEATAKPLSCEKGEQGAAASGAMSMTSKPVLIATGTKILPEVDFLLPPEEFPLKVSRVYNKNLTRAGAFGEKWSSNLEHSLSFEYNGIFCGGRLDAALPCSPNGNPLTLIHANGEGGFARKFTAAANGQWLSDASSIVQSGANWIMTGPDGAQEVYDAFGRPLTIKNGPTRLL